MRILLVSVNRETVPAPVVPLGLSYVAASVLRDGHRVELLDLCFSSDAGRDIGDALRRFPPELVGISIRNVDNLTFPGSVSYVGEIRSAVEALKKGTGAPIVAGGPGFSIFPDALMSILGIPFGIVGEGEEAFRALASSLELGREAPDLPNLLAPGRRPARPRPPGGGFTEGGLPARVPLSSISPARCHSMW